MCFHSRREEVLTVKEAKVWRVNLSQRTSKHMYKETFGPGIQLYLIPCKLHKPYTVETQTATEIIVIYRSASVGPRLTHFKGQLMKT